MRRMLHRLFLRLRPIGAIQLYRVERWYAGYHPVGRSRLSRAILQIQMPPQLHWNDEPP